MENNSNKEEDTYDDDPIIFFGIENRSVFEGVITPEKLFDFKTLVDDLKSSDPNLYLKSMINFRNVLSIEESPLRQKVIDANVIPRMVEFLSYNDQPQLQLDACWALTNIVSGSSDQIRVVIETGAVAKFRDLLQSPSDDVREQAVWALANIAGDAVYIKSVLSQDVMEPLLKILSGTTKISMMRRATWALSNFCKGPWELASPAIPTLARLIFASDEEVLEYTCWALFFLSNGSDEKIQAIIDAGICRRVVELLSHSSSSVQIPAQRIVGNIVSGDEAQTQIMIGYAFLPSLLPLLSSPNNNLQKETCWTISNITAGNCSQIQAVIDAQLIPRLIALLSSNDINIKKEAAYALNNATGGSPSQIRYLVDCNIINPLCELISASDNRIVLVALQALGNILKVGEQEAKKSTGINQYAVLLRECGGIKIEKFQNQQIEIQKAINILRKLSGEVSKIY